MNAVPIPKARFNQEALRNKFWMNYALFFLVLGIILVTATISPGFRTQANLQNVLISFVPLGIVAMGQAIVIIVRGFDLSIGSMMASAAVVATEFGQMGLSGFFVAIVVTCIVSLVVGFINGFLVVKRQVSPFLATLATMIVLQGLRFAWTQGAPSGRVPDLLRFIGSSKIFEVPVSLMVLLVIGGSVWVLLTHTPFGRRIYMIGGGPRAAELVGVKVSSIVIRCYMASALLAGLGGLVLAGYVSGVDNWVGRGYELDSVVAAVIGGVALSGGKGNVLNALLGAFLLTVIFNIVLLLGFGVQMQYIVKGIIIISALAIYRFFPGTARVGSSE